MAQIFAIQQMLGNVIVILVYLALQKLTTRQPDDAQVEVAIAALMVVLDAEGIDPRSIALTKEKPSMEAAPGAS